MAFVMIGNAVELNEGPHPASLASNDNSLTSRQAFATSPPTCLVPDKPPARGIPSPCTAAGDHGHILQTGSCSCATHFSSPQLDATNVHPSPMLQSPDAAVCQSEAGECTLNNPDTIKDDILKNPIPVVRDVLHDTARALETSYAPRDIIVNNASNLDARCCSINRVGRDQHQHYHFNINLCPHASTNTPLDGVKTASDHDIHAEPNTQLKYAVNWVKGFIATSIATIFAIA